MTPSNEITDSYLKDNQDDMAIDKKACDFAGKPLVVPNQQPGLCVIGGIDTVEQLDKNTSANAISSLRAASVYNLVTPVWKYSLHQLRRSSIAAFLTPIWNKIKAFKNVRVIVSQSQSSQFQDLWSKSNAVAYSSDTPV